FAQPLPLYDAALLEREMRLFDTWFLVDHLGLTLTPSQQAVIDTAYAWLVQEILAQPRVVVHRDYHCRNLMWREADQRLGIIDFQDAVLGPVTYALVSLFRDAYIAWPTAQVRVWVDDFHAQWTARGSPAAAPESVAPRPDEFWRWFALMGAQRHL